MYASPITSLQLLRLLDVVRQLAGLRAVQPLLEQLVTCVFELIPADVCLVTFFNTPTAREQSITRTRIGEALTDADERIDHAIIQQTHATMLPVRIADQRAASCLDPAPSTGDHGRHSVVCVPFISQARAIGVIYAATTTSSQFSEDDLALLVLFVNQVVIALEHARLNDLLDDTAARQTQPLSQPTEAALVGEVLARVAHELRNPLHIITNLATLSVGLVDECNSLLGQLHEPQIVDSSTAMHDLLTYMRRNCQAIATSGQRATSIIAAMLDMRARHEQRQHFDLNQLIEQSLELAYQGMLAHPTKAQAIAFERDLEANLPPIEGYSLRLSQALLNIIENACDAAWQKHQEQPDLQPVVQLTTRFTRRTAALEAATDAIEIRIRDNGTGIAVPIQPQLFEPFVTTKPPGSGTGLGLALAYAIIADEHRGTLRAVSEPPQFTEFIIQLPV